MHSKSCLFRSFDLFGSARSNLHWTITGTRVNRGPLFLGRQREALHPNARVRHGELVQDQSSQHLNQGLHCQVRFKKDHRERLVLKPRLRKHPSRQPVTLSPIGSAGRLKPQPEQGIKAWELGETHLKNGAGFAPKPKQDLLPAVFLPPWGGQIGRRTCARVERGRRICPDRTHALEVAQLRSGIRKERRPCWQMHPISRTLYIYI